MNALADFLSGGAAALDILTVCRIFAIALLIELFGMCFSIAGSLGR